MNIAYIILAHKNPSQIKRLIEKLTYSNDWFFVHIDAKKEMTSFENALSSEKNVTFIKERINGQWGAFGIVEATINALKAISKSSENFERIVLLSGQDYPIKSTELIHSFFEGNKNKNFIEFDAFPVKKLTYGGLHRIHHYSYSLLNKRLTYLPKHCTENLNFKGKFVNAILKKMHTFSKKRELPYFLKAYYGSQWWSMTEKTSLSVLSYLNSHPKYVQYHKRSLSPDEMFFQTLLLNMNSSDVNENDNKRLILWEKGSSHPVNIDDRHFAILKESDCLFARKFEKDSNILDRIDKEILNHS